LYEINPNEQISFPAFSVAFTYLESNSQFFKSENLLQTECQTLSIQLSNASCLVSQKKAEYDNSSIEIHFTLQLVIIRLFEYVPILY